MALNGGRSWRAYFSGQDAAIAVVAVPVLAVVSFGLAAVARHPLAGFGALAVDLAGIGAALGLANIFTAAVPYPAEKRAGSPTPRPASGYMGHSVGGTFGILIAVGVVAAPVIIGFVAWNSSHAAVRLPLLAVAAAVYGLVLAWIGLRIAAAVATQKVPELYQIALKSNL